MKNFEIISMHDLQLFAEGGPAAGAVGGIGAGGTGVTAPVAGVQAENAPVAEVQNPTEQTVPVDLAAEFESLIKGKYKEQYDARVKDTIQKRLRGPTEAASKYKALMPILEILASKYGVDASDVEGLSRAVQDDNAFYEVEALERGLTVSQLKDIKKMERENAALRQRQEEIRRQEEGRRQYDAWMKQAETAKLVYPSLDLAAEINNPQFMDLLRAGVDVKAAYTVVHQDDIISGAMQTAAHTAAQKVANSVVAGASRPNENGSGQGAATVKTDVSKMTKAQRQNLILRAARGEKITF